MNKEEFTKKLQTLTPQPRSVLALMLGGHSDREISDKLQATPATIRKHVQNLCDHFGIEAEVGGLRRNRRKYLMALARQYESELLGAHPVATPQEAVVARTVLHKTAQVDDTVTNVVSVSSSDSGGKENLERRQPSLQPETPESQVKLEGQWRLDDGEWRYKGRIILETEQLTLPQLKALLELLRESSGDVTLRIERIETGSVVLVLGGSQEGLGRLEFLFRSGQLTEIWGIPIMDVRLEGNKLRFQFSPEEQDEVWPTKSNYSNFDACWNAYLNKLCLNALIHWLRDQCRLQPVVWPSPDACAAIWEVVNGTAIEQGTRRVVLIPSEASEESTTETEQLCVPQELIDIPSWTAHYYLSVRVFSSDGEIEVWGYATHHKLKREGRYDRQQRTYCLNREDLIENLNWMPVGGRVCTEDRPAVALLPSLSNTEAEALLEQLGRVSCQSPRLEVPFENWAALLEVPQWRQQLYERRLGRFCPAVAPSQTSVNLSRWLQNNFVEAVQAGWQTIEEMFGQRQVAFRSAVVRRAKQIDLGGSHTFVMTVDVSSETDEEMEIGILLRLYPTGNQTYLPENLKLIVLDESGATFREVAARSNDDWIQYQLTGSPGDRFSVLVALGELSLIENFEI